MSGSEITKNAVRHHVLALSKLFGVDPTVDCNMLEFANRLETSIDKFGSTQINCRAELEVLCEGNSQADELMQRFDEVKLRNVRELAPIIYLYSRVKGDAHLSAVLEHMSKLKLPDHMCDLVKSPNVTLARQGVDQLQQLIADASTVTGSSMHSVANERTLRTALAASMDGPLFVETTSRTDSRMTDKYNSLSRRTPLHTRQDRTDVTIQGGGKDNDSRARLPILPSWRFERPSLRTDFLLLTDTYNENYPKAPLQSLSSDMQEHCVVSDLLRLLQGNQGVYVKPVPLSSRSSIRLFHIDENMNPSLMDTTNKILPICSDYSLIARFIDEKSLFGQGTVNHALADAMQRLIKDYFVLLCQLEHEFRGGRLGISRLQFTLQDTAHLFAHLARIATDIQTGNCTGGAVLSLLHDSTRKVYGVQQLHELALYLLRAASIPFFAILQKWIFRGVICDPYNEFFITAAPTPESLQTCLTGSTVRDDRAIRDNVNWAYFWEQHYSVVPYNVPTFLDSHVSMCLNSGKYLNVVQQCSDGYELPAVETLEYDETESKYIDQIDRAHLYASNLLLKLMIKDKELKEHLNSVKRYFLLDQADFIVHFMDAATHELCKPSTDVSLVRLSSLLETAIRTSTATVDPFKDNLKVVIYNYDLITQILLVLQAGSGLEKATTPVEDSNLTGFEAFSVDYSVRWPISLVLNRQVMDRYQMLFRHMFYCKHVERRLCGAWVLGKMARKADCLTSTWYTTAFLLGQRMLTFVQHFQYYMSVEVIEPTWDHFFRQMDKVSNLDALLEAHIYCLEVCMDDCLLASPDLLSLFGKLAVICVLFANFIQRVVSASPGGLEDVGGWTHHEPRPLLQDIYPHATPYNLVDQAEKGPGSQSSYAPSLASGDTVLTKVTREDFNQLGTSAAFAQSVIDFDRKFNSLLVEFVDKLKHYSKERNKLSSLASRLDFNDFYSTTSASSSDIPQPTHTDPLAPSSRQFNCRSSRSTNFSGTEYMPPIRQSRSHTSSITIDRDDDYI